MNYNRRLNEHEHFSHWQLCLGLCLLLIFILLIGHSWYQSWYFYGFWSLDVFDSNWQELGNWLAPLVSFATITGIFIALFQFNRAIKNREEDSESIRFRNTQGVFNFFITDIIPLTHIVEKSVYDSLIDILVAHGIN